MALLRAGRVAAAALAALVLCSCVGPETTQSASEPRSSVSRIRVINDSTTDLSDLRLGFPEEEVLVGDVAAGATSDYVEVPNGVHSYSAFRHTRDGEEIVQFALDLGGQSSLPIDDYTYLLNVDPDSDYPIGMRTVLRTLPTAAEAIHSQALWVRVSNGGPDDLTGYTMKFPGKQQIYFGSVPAGLTSQYAMLYGGRMHRQAALEYIEAGEVVTQPQPETSGSDASATPSGPPYDGGVFTFVVSYDQSRAAGSHVEQLDVLEAEVES